ncbi:NlpC/P60 family protein [Pseudoxanthomonas helianthi]
MTTDDLRLGLPAATRRLKGATVFFLALAVGLTSAASFAKTASSTSAKPATEKSASKSPASKKKAAASSQAKKKTGSAKATDKKAKGKVAATKGSEAKKATAKADSKKKGDKNPAPPAETAAIAAPVKEKLAATPARTVALLPIEATGGIAAAKAEAPAAASIDVEKKGEPAADKSAAAVRAKADTDARGGIRGMASDAAASTLTLLLPRLAAGDDTMPLLGRSTQVASDLGRLLSGQSASDAPPPSDKVQSVLKRALTLLGTPYRWGGTSPDSGFDCSGLVGYVFRTALGIELPRVSRDMARNKDALLIKSRDELREGDLVFFGRRKGRIDHVGIYLGNGQFVHAPRTGKDVEVSSLMSGYWSTRFMQARRVEM